ncbi:hypothetical protein RRSWK_01218 [Rhodopirellula sp. SWK7]|nr:hypothetical protein RRSWK_01218 [Rhodopirellula sp. SWK7]
MRSPTQRFTTQASRSTTTGKAFAHIRVISGPLIPGVHMPANHTNDRE